jgi:diacylglycerol kinase family enzyme
MGRSVSTNRCTQRPRWTLDRVDTCAAGDARRMALECDAARYAVIAAAGGDGKINEVVNGLASRLAALVLGRLPAMSG